MSRFAPGAKSCCTMHTPAWTAVPSGGEKESMQAVQHTLLQTRHAGTDETGDALFRSPDADLRSLGGNQASVGIDMVGSEND